MGEEDVQSTDDDCYSKKVEKDSCVYKLLKQQSDEILRIQQLYKLSFDRAVLIWLTNRK